MIGYIDKSTKYLMKSITTRELWNNIMHHREFDRMPVLHWQGWPETYDRWYKEGLPKNVDEHEYFNTDPFHSYLSLNMELYPPFDEETLEETNKYRVFRQEDGVIAKHLKSKSSIPSFIDFTFKDASCWKEYEWRLQPDIGRIPQDFQDQISRIKSSGGSIAVATGSMIGWLRNWMGVENLAYLCYDDPEVLAEIVNTITKLVCWSLDKILPQVKADCGWGWEDICFRSGPLINPKIFQRVAVPGYQKIAEKLNEYNIDLYVVDSDGLIDSLIPHWLDGGVNVLFPVEIGVWKADPMMIRKKYGRQLRIIGGIDKLTIAKGPETIDEEIARRLPLMADGGYIPLPDHLIPPETSLEHYVYYLNKIRELRF